jgi:hypothetical protein
MTSAFGIFLLLAASVGYSQDLPLVCSADKSVVESGDTVQLTAWAPDEHLELHWSATDGFQAEGSQVMWSPGKQEPGRKTVDVTATWEGRPALHCTVQVFVQFHVDTRGKPRRFLLGPKDVEAGLGPKDVRERSYGLYSYLLLTAEEGDQEAQDRNRKCIEAYRARILTASRLEASVDRALLNAIYVPVVAGSPDPDPSAEWIFNNYDYHRADDLLHKLPGVHLHGPYLVSTAQPLSRYTAGPLLGFDLSWVPARTVRFWVEQFMAQGEQEPWDKPEKLATFELKLRTLISVAAENLPKTREGLAAILTLLR